MTRQKKELLKRIWEINTFIEADDQLGYSFADARYYRSLYEEIERLAEELAHLRGFKDLQEERRYEMGLYRDDYLPYI